MPCEKRISPHIEEVIILLLADKADWATGAKWDVDGCVMAGR